MNTEFQPLLSSSLTDISERLNHAFGGYIVPLRFEAPMLAGLIRAESIDLNACRMAIVDGKPAGIGLIARRGFDCRLAAMAINPEFRSRGVGRLLVRELIEDAKARGERRMVLEVIEQNAPAVRLYEFCGFRRVRRLVGFNGNSLTGQPDPALVECDIREAAHAIATHAPDLPWQISGWTLGQLSAPNRAYRAGPAHAIISDPGGESIALRGLAVPTLQRNQGFGSALLRALVAAHPDRKWRITPVVPEAAENRLFLTCGFVQESLSQLEMSIQL